ncbi:MAG: hypothetical protein M1815_000899 [Lichina confinis]|nr:MAG: hypothetical protein M1815_000899 [Lichina confinis]
MLGWIGLETIFLALAAARGATATYINDTDRFFPELEPPPNSTIVGDGRMTHGLAHFRHGGSREQPHFCPHTRRPDFAPSAAIELRAYPNKDELVYVVPISVGGQLLHLQLDTGSADLYVLGPDVPRQKTIGRSTFKGRDFERIDGVRFELNYVGGDSAIGFVGRSPIGFGGLTLEKQTVNVATDVRYSAIMDGLVGLGTGKGIAGANARPNPFLECLMTSIRHPVFAASLRPAAPSSYQFGYVDANKYRGPLKPIRVDPTNGQWQFSSSGARVGKVLIRRLMPSLIDTGSSLLRMQQAVVRAYYSQVPGSKMSRSDEGYIVPCDSDLPDLDIFIEDYTAVIPGDLIRGPPVRLEGHCLGTLQDEVDGIQSFGVVFLKSQYTVFDRGNFVVAFAPHA